MTRYIFIAALFALAGCTSVSVRDEGVDLPPIPPELLADCEPPIEPTGPTFADIYSNAVQNAVGPWARCWALHRQASSVIRYRDEVAAKIKADRAKQKPWYRFLGN